MIERPEVGDHEVWGEDIGHASTCSRHIHKSCECDCPKQYYCCDCDAQHWDGHCPRTVLDDIVEALDE